MDVNKLAIFFSVFCLVMIISGCAKLEPAPPASEISVPMVPISWVNNEQFEDVTQTSRTQMFSQIADASLMALVNQALTANLSLQARESDLLALALQSRQSVGALLPQMELSTTANRSKVNALLEDDQIISREKTIELFASWELDVWGKVRAADAAERAQIEQASYDLDAQRIALTGLVTRQWLNLWLAQQLIVLEDERIQIFSILEQSASEQYQSGLVSREDVLLARISLKSASATKEELNFQQQEISRQLEVTLGQYPQAALVFPDALPNIHQPIPSLPAELIANRPDIKAAYAQVHVAHFKQESLYKALLPSISLTASVGKTRPSWRNLLESSLLWSVVGGITQNLYVQDLIGAGPVSLAKAASYEKQSAIYDYQQALLDAFFEVENALHQERVLFTRQQLLDNAVKDADDVYVDYLQRYRDGLLSLVDVLTVQERLLATRQALLEVQAEIWFNRVRLGLALGISVTENNRDTKENI
jgi:NodT family efflux transporter outer membrane factor (OMF) lipoprotein